MLASFTKPSVRYNSQPGGESMKNTVFHKCCSINVHVATTSRKHQTKHVKRKQPFGAVRVDHLDTQLSAAVCVCVQVVGDNIWLKTSLTS